MPKMIHITDSRNWLQRYEEGKSEASIAKDAKRDIKTVKNGIQKAREERRINIVQTEFLREALRKHQDQLLAAITEIKAALIVPDINIQPELRTKLGLVNIADSPDKRMQVVLSVESTPQ
jgi:hypothetical protein